MPTNNSIPHPRGVVNGNGHTKAPGPMANGHTEGPARRRPADHHRLNGDGRHLGNGHAGNGNGPRSPSPGGKSIADTLAGLGELQAPDEVAIGIPGYEPDETADTASWEDVAKVVAGTRWLLRGWVPYGMLSGIIAEPKMGKSAWVLWYLVRPLILGLPWFTGQGAREPGHVVWCDTEGSMGLNIERARAWGLPLGRLKMPFPDDPFRRIDLNSAEDIGRITSVVCRYKAKLVVVDSYRGAHDKDENNSCSGSGLSNLAGVAGETKAAVHIIHHTGKPAPGAEITANSARGSNVFLAMVRCLLGVDRPDPKSAWRRVRVLCENFGTAPKPAGFRIGGAGLEDGPAPEPPEPEKRETGKDRVEDWLRVRMRPGQWYAAQPVIDEAEALGFPHAGTLKRAKAALGVKTRKGGKGWEWCRVEGGQGGAGEGSTPAAFAT